MNISSASSAVENAFFIVGPTACGKSELAAEVAQRLGAEIVNVDAFQIYRGLPLLTGQPHESTLQKAPHHLFGTISLGEAMSAAKFRELAFDALEKIHRRGKRALLVGGSGLYIKALTHGLAPTPPINRDLRAELNALSLAELNALLDRGLAQSGSVGATGVDRKNKRRVVRALEILATKNLLGKKLEPRHAGDIYLGDIPESGMRQRQDWGAPEAGPPSGDTLGSLNGGAADLEDIPEAGILQGRESNIPEASMPAPEPGLPGPQEANSPASAIPGSGIAPARVENEWKTHADLHGILVLRERAELYQRIDQRVVEMFRDGVVEEVARASAVGATAAKTIGFAQIQQLLAGEISIAACIIALQQATRRYAKRQLTWFRHQSSFEMLNLSLLNDHSAAVDSILQKAARAFANAE